MSKKKDVTIKDLAQETNLSISTVSRVINGKAKEFRIGKKSQALILETAKKLNYKANYAAASLRSGKSSTVALLIPSLSEPFFAGIASEIINDLRGDGYTTILMESNESLKFEQEILKNLQKRNLEGLIIVPSGDKYEHIVELKKQGLPIVCIDRYFENLNLPYVSTDNYFGAFSATNYLIKNGHSNIAAIQGVRNSVPNRHRIKGFKDAMKASGLEKIYISGNAFSIQNGYLETKVILRNRVKPTAIFAFSNNIALGCLKALREENMKIPENISIITFDDHPYLNYLSTPLSCIVQPEADIAKLAIRFLFSLINNDPVDNQQILLKPELKIRESVGTR